MKLKTLTTLAMVLATTQIANASAITGGNGGTGTAFPPDLSGAINSVVVDHNGAGANPLTEATGTVTVDADAFAKLRPFDINFGMIDTTGIDGIATRTYNFAVTLENAIGSAGTANPAESGAVEGDNIQNIEFEIVGGPHTFLPAAMGGVGGPDAPLIYTNGMGNEVLRFGGIRGGGPAIAVGATRTFNFAVTTLAQNGTFSLRITANPEPGSIILAMIVAMAFGGYYYHQRRKQATPEAAAMVA